jgi:hypothetical protein
MDPRYGVRAGLASGQTMTTGFYDCSQVMVIDQVPSTIATANIAALANVTSGTAMTLVAATGAGITVTTAATPVLQTNNVVPSGARVIDSVPAVISFGASGAVVCQDPRTSIARAVSITGVASGTGGAFKVAGYDLYGIAQNETITATSGATTTNGAKGWKFITSVTPQFTDAHNYSVGTTDIYEFPLAAYFWGDATITWNNGIMTANTGFVAAVTSTATATTGSTRGTYLLQATASDGTRRLRIIQSILPYAAGQTNGSSSLFGMLPF